MQEFSFWTKQTPPLPSPRASAAFCNQRRGERDEVANWSAVALAKAEGRVRGRLNFKMRIAAQQASPSGG